MGVIEAIGTRPLGESGKKSKLPQPAEPPLTLFPLSTVDEKPLTLTTLRRHEGLQKQERRQAWKDFWDSFSPPMDNTTAPQDPDPPASP